MEDWKAEIEQAQAIGIDGFALNCAPPSVDKYTPDQLAHAYAAAEEMDFKVFISFDFAYWTPGDTGLITDYLANFTASPAQAYYNDGAIVSTFIGNAMDWNPVKSSLSDQKLTVIPNVEDPNSIPGATNGLDGAFSWYAWPTSGENKVIKGPMTTVWDDMFIQNLGDKPYMAREYNLSPSPPLSRILTLYSRVPVVLYAFCQQELGVYLRGAAHAPLGADARHEAPDD